MGQNQSNLIKLCIRYVPVPTSTYLKVPRYIYTLIKCRTLVLMSEVSTLRPITSYTRNLSLFLLGTSTYIHSPLEQYPVPQDPDRLYLYLYNISIVERRLRILKPANPCRRSRHDRRAIWQGCSYSQRFVQYVISESKPWVGRWLTLR